MSRNTGSLYVHIPFCPRKCLYCAFNSRAGADEALKQAYVHAVIRELGRLGGGRPLPLRTVYIGGGTPTALSAPLLGRLLAAITARMDGGPPKEWTVEANPGTLDPGILQILVEAPVTRISMGVQSFDPDLLQLLGRVHGPREVHLSVEALREAGLHEINLDLMYGLPGQSLGAWIRDLDALLDLAPPHMSLYALQMEAGTAFHRAWTSGELGEPPQELVRAQDAAAVERVTPRGYRQYEVSNYALSGHASRHNYVYWRNQPYHGVGAGAYGREGNLRYRNETDPRRYIAAVLSGRSPVVERDVLEPRDDYVETLSSGLRTTEGVDLDALQAHCGLDPRRLHGRHLAALIRGGLAGLKGSRLVLTAEGRWLLDSVMLPFLDGLPERREAVV